VSYNRRDVIAGAGALAAVAALPACTRTAPKTASSPAADANVSRILGEVAEDLLAEYPENATALGLDKEARAALKSRLTDRSLAGQRRLAANASARLSKLQRIDRAPLSPGVATDLAVVQTAHETAVEGFAFPYGDVVTLNQQYSYRNSPYVVTQNTGAFVEIPDFLDSNHKIENAADAEAYLARLESYGAVLDGETERLRANAAAGAIAPSFLLDKAIKQMRSARAEPIGRWGLVESLARRTSGFGGDWRARADRIVRQRVAPAMDRQIAELVRHRARADDRAGVWKLPQGDAYYAWALRASTTTRLTPDEVFNRGQEELRTLHARMDPLLRAQGLAQGTVGQRMTALGKDPRHLFPNTDAGRQQILDYINAKVADIKARMPRAHATLVPGNLVVKRVPPAIEAGAPGGYAAAGTIDGSVPGMYYINLRDTGIWPRYALPTLTYHEGVPGHIWQGEYTYKLPLVRSLLAFNAYSEGWALYASSSATSSASTRAIRSANSAISSRSPSAPAAWWSTPGSTPSAGPGPKRSNGSPRPTAPRSRKSRARSTVTAPGPPRPAATRSATARSTGCAPRPSRRSAAATTSGCSTMPWCSPAASRSPSSNRRSIATSPPAPSASPP
jgi:uncharacterized protein (DUF885 family)